MNAHWWLDDYAFSVTVVAGDPATFEEAVMYHEWRKAMETEMDSIERNETWELTDVPVGVKTIGVKWVYQ